MPGLFCRNNSVPVPVYLVISRCAGFPWGGRIDGGVRYEPSAWRLGLAVALFPFWLFWHGVWAVIRSY